MATESAEQRDRCASRKEAAHVELAEETATLIESLTDLLGPSATQSVMGQRIWRGGAWTSIEARCNPAV